MGHITNRDVFGIVNRGGSVSGHSRNFYGYAEVGSYFSANRGYIPKGVARALDALAERHGGYTGVLYSYATPIAVRIAGVWFAPDVSYSATTGSKHQGNLGIVSWVPWDAGVDELESILYGYIKYDRCSKKYNRGPNRREETR